LLTGQLKARCIEQLQEFVGAFQQVCIAHLVGTRINLSLQRRAAITEELVSTFMDKTRKIEPTIGKPQPQPQAE